MNQNKLDITKRFAHSLSRSDRFLKAGIIALLALILCSVAIGAAAADEPTTVTTEAGLTDAVVAGGEVILGNNISLSKTLRISQVVTLDLGGWVLSLQNGKNGSVIRIESGGNLTLKDSAPATPHTFTFVKNGPWTLDASLAAGAVPLANFDRAAAEATRVGNYHVSILGGVITGGSAEMGGGVRVDEYSTFTMSGGSIAGNSAAGGGGVYVNGGTFTMYGSSIAGNCADGSGGVYVGGSGTFTMSGGSIVGNSATLAGGVVSEGGTFTMSGGSIAGNSAGDGGGVAVTSQGKFYVSGAPVIKNNTGANGAANNVYLAKEQEVQAFITVTGDFDGEIYINSPAPTKFPEIPIQFGIADQMYEGADRFISDASDESGNHYVGEWGAESGGQYPLNWEYEATAYSITIADGIQNGTVTASHAFAKEDTEITLTPTPNEDCVFKGWDVRAGGTTVPVSDNKFKMPGSAVTVSATFEKEAPAVTYTITFMSDGEVWRTDDVNEGSTVDKPDDDPVKDGFAFAKWLAADSTEYDFSTPVYSDITLTAKWNTKAPESEEEIDELIDELQDSDKEVTVPVNNMNFARMLLQKARDAGVKDKISIDPTAGDEVELMELIHAAEQGGYSPVNLETVKDTKKKVGELIAKETVQKEDIALPVKADGSNINVVLEVIEEYAPVTSQVSVPIPNAVRIPKATEIKPSAPTEDIVKDLLTKAVDSATADNVHLILTEQNKDAVKKITEKLHGLIVKVTEDNKGLVEDLIVNDKAVITLTVDDDNKEIIKKLAEDHLDIDIIVEVTDVNGTIIDGLLSGGTPLCLKVAEDGNNIETILDMQKYRTEVKGVHTPSKIILSDDVKMEITGEEKNTEILQRLLKAVIAGADTATGLVTLDTGTEERNLRLVVEELLGAKGVNAPIIKEFDHTHQPDIEEIVPVIMAPADGHAYPGYSTNIKPEAEKYVNSVELYDAENAASILVTKMDTHVLGEGTIIPQEIPASTGYTSQSVYTVFQTYGTAVDKEKPVTVEFVVNSKPGYGNGTENYYLKYLNPETNTWERSHITMTGKPEKVEGTDNIWICTFNLENPGVYAFVYEEKVRNTTKGTSVWAVETPEPTVTPTETPTVEPTQGQGIPTIKPMTQTPTGKSPALFMGILAGLGVAAVVFGLRRR